MDTFTANVPLASSCLRLAAIHLDRARRKQEPGSPGAAETRLAHEEVCAALTALDGGERDPAPRDEGENSSFGLRPDSV